MSNFDERVATLVEEMVVLEEIKLYSADESKTILAKRKQFEHNIGQLTSTSNDFIEYIKSEKLFLREIITRKKKLRMNKNKGGIEERVIRRIEALYLITLRQYFEVSLFVSFLNFCESYHIMDIVPKAITRLLELHPQQPQIWSIAGKWYAYDYGDETRAFEIFYEGLALHKDNKMLYNNMLGIAMASYHRLEEPKDSSAQETCANKMEKIVIAAFPNIIDSDFFITLLNVLTTKYPFTRKIQDSISEHLIQNFSEDVNVWHTLAQRELRDDNYVYVVTAVNEEGAASMILDLTDTIDLSPRDKLLACIHKYKDGLAAVPPLKKGELWKFYLDFLFELPRDPKSLNVDIILPTLNAALAEASEEENALKEMHYIDWLKLLDEEKGLSLAEKGLAAFPQSVFLWNRRLQLEMIENTKSEVDKVFRRSVEALKEKALPLWLTVLRYHLMTSTNAYIQSLYKEGLEQPEEVSQSLKPRYIQWLADARGTYAAREAYIEIAELQPYCKDIHLTMMRYESLFQDDHENWVRAHKLACEQFGNTDVDVWIGYLSYYMVYNKKCSNRKQHVRRIFSRAMESLQEDLKAPFQISFENLRKRCARAKYENRKSLLPIVC